MTFENDSSREAGSTVSGAGFDQDLSEVVAIPETSGRHGHFELLVVVSELDRQNVAPGLLRQISLDDVSDHLR